MNRLIAAITREEDRFKAVLLEQSGRRYELRCCLTRSTSGNKWSTLFDDLQRAAEGRLTSGPIVGFDSRSVGIYALHLPTMRHAELDGVVHLQAERLLPLPPEQMTLAWEAHSPMNGKMPVTLAAGRSDTLRRFVAEVRDVKPLRILLDCQALVTAWQELYGGSEPEALLIHPGPNRTLICYAKAGCLRGVQSLDIGLQELREGNKLNSPAAESLAHDVRAALRQFQKGDEPLPVILLSDGADFSSDLAAYLDRTKLPVQVATLQADTTLTVSDRDRPHLHEYLMPVSLALAGSAAEPAGLDLFGQIYDKTAEETPIAWKRPSPLAWAIVMCLLLLTGIGVAIRADQRRLSLYQKGLSSNQAIHRMVENRRTREMIQARRVDPLEILDRVNLADMGAVRLTGLNFHRGQLCRLSGHVPQKEAIYDYLAALQDQPGVANVFLDRSAFDESKKRFTFSITFHYKDWTRKSLK